MPSVRCLECQLLCKPECREDLFAPSLSSAWKVGAGFTAYDRVLCKMDNSVYGLYATPFELTLNIE